MDRWVEGEDEMNRKVVELSSPLTRQSSSSLCSDSLRALVHVVLSRLGVELGCLKESSLLSEVEKSLEATSIALHSRVPLRE